MHNPMPLWAQLVLVLTCPLWVPCSVVVVVVQNRRTGTDRPSRAP